MADPAPTPKRMPLVGFRFSPTDQELVAHFLNHKLKADDPSIHDYIPEIDVCKYEPWELPALSPITPDDQVWFFFSPRDYKYSNSTRSNRATSCGYWKITGKDRKIKAEGTNKVIGIKKTLVFYKGRVPHVIKTDWVIHEYHDVKSTSKQMTYVLCKLIKQTDKKIKNKKDKLAYDENKLDSHLICEYENQANVDMTSESVVDMMSESEEQCFINMDSTKQILQTDEFVDPMIQLPLKSSMKTTFELDEYDFIELDESELQELWKMI